MEVKISRVKVGRVVKPYNELMLFNIHLHFNGALAKNGGFYFVFLQNKGESVGWFAGWRGILMDIFLFVYFGPGGNGIQDHYF